MKYIIICLLLLSVLALNVGCKKATEAQYTIDQNKCISCGKCADVCPHNAIVYSNGKASIIQSKCKACGLCVPACPKYAIH